MKLSNFEWTDKDSLRWFIMLPSGHEGPYSLESLKNRCQQKKISLESKIWSEGLPDTVSIKEALYHFEASKNVPAVPTIQEEVPPIPGEDIPPLPPLPQEEVPIQKAKSPVSFVGPVLGVVILLSFYLFYVQWLKGQEKFTIHRQSKMSLELQERIQKEMQFDGWDKKIFFKEFVPSDLSVIWFVTSSFQACEVEAEFTSVKDKLLSFKTSEVSFKSRGLLNNHIVELSRFEFISGTKVIPGLYEVDIRAKSCEWDGLIPNVANSFSEPDKEYLARTKVVLFPQGAQEFNLLLERLIAKKIEMIRKAQSTENVFWQEMVEKLQTLEAISLQIEQFFMELLEKDARKFPQNLKEGVQVYTRQFGHTLTSFVISNEDDFNKMPTDGAAKISELKDYENMIKLMSKEIGLESMKIIERLQSLKVTKRVNLNEEKLKIQKSFSALEEKIKQKIILIEAQKVR
jgi:hypothetical protein